jgi:hypothetical protein
MAIHGPLARRGYNAAVQEMIRRHQTFACVAAAVLLAAAVRMPFWLADTYAYGHGDAIIWQVWSRATYEHGFINVLRTADSNNIGYHYVLWPISAIYGLMSPEYELWTAPIRILMKVPPFLCDLGLTALIFGAARGLVPAEATARRRDALAAASALAFALAPATVYDSMWWTQIDSVITLCMLGAVVLLARGHIEAAWAVWAVGFLIKPQPVVIVPVLAAYTFWSYGWWAAVRGGAAVAATTLLTLAPFLLHGDADLIRETYRRMFEQGPIDLVQGAWNGWSILDVRDDPVPSDAVVDAGAWELTYSQVSLLLSGVATIVVLAFLRLHRDATGLLIACAAMVFTFYMVPTSTHERYLYPAFAFAAPVLVRAPRLWLLFAVLQATFFLNLLAINPPNDDGFWQWHGTRFAVGVAAWHTLVYLGVMCALLYAAMGSILRPSPRSAPLASAPLPSRERAARRL